MHEHKTGPKLPPWQYSALETAAFGFDCFALFRRALCDDSPTFFGLQLPRSKQQEDPGQETSYSIVTSG